MKWGRPGTSSPAATAVSSACCGRRTESEAKAHAWSPRRARRRRSCAWPCCARSSSAAAPMEPCASGAPRLAGVGMTPCAMEMARAMPSACLCAVCGCSARSAASTCAPRRSSCARESCPSRPAPPACRTRRMCCVDARKATSSCSTRRASRFVVLGLISPTASPGTWLRPHASIHAMPLAHPSHICAVTRLASCDVAWRTRRHMRTQPSVP